jgi:hypothetical protein
MRVSLCSSVLVVYSLNLLPFLHAMDASPHTFYERQPDGTLISLMEHGDEVENWVSDLEGKFGLEFWSQETTLEI